MKTAIQLEGLRKAYYRGMLRRRRQPVLRDLHLRIPAGIIFGILGPNGAGKTTLISIMATLLLPDAGSVRVLGLDALQQAAQLRQRINLASGAAKFVWSLTVEENLRFYGRLYGLRGDSLTERVREVVALFELEAWRRSPFETLSSGLKQRLALAKALISRPELLFLDEPTNGLDPVAAQHTREEIARLNRQSGMTIILTTHNMREAEMLCHEVGFLGEGQILAQGGIPALQAQLALGDRVTLLFAGKPPEMNFQGLPGVLEWRLQSPEVELVLDHSDSRLPGIIREIDAAGGDLSQIRVQEVDLEDLYREFSQ
ncbi:ABC transporter ATP-binding protein [Desulfobacca acetoxidans]|uniref:Polyamine-transporting ATPase n=1 Tax=Desulfobacca acetoxidans (strain ATCC 700848 / DSM 11109 / ASRB2) TaxID=880072 RepID=F2NJU1_DESAR|nr:ABC transporter ATP-binding protein [Desulfobacca acetoxidans]AEB09746.1 Polyamine-transporting ATPase [Desulfobacca acetoxidans DSM 11109]